MRLELGFHAAYRDLHEPSRICVTPHTDHIPGAKSHIFSARLASFRFGKPPGYQDWAGIEQPLTIAGDTENVTYSSSPTILIQDFGNIKIEEKG